MPMFRTFIALLLTLSPLLSHAQVTARLQASPIGVGGEVGYRFDGPLGIRAGYLVGDLDVDFDADDNNGIEGDELQYDSDIDLKNAYLLADWHPWNGLFRVTGGAFYNNSGATVVTRCNASPFLLPGTATCEFGNSLYPAAVLGEVTTRVDFKEFAPYIGVGWGHAVRSGFAFNVDLGVAYLGNARVDMRSNGSCNNDRQCRAEIEKEEREIEKEVGKYRWLPYAAIGVSYRF